LRSGTLFGASFLKEVESSHVNAIRNRIALLAVLWVLHSLKAIAEKNFSVEVARNNLATFSKHVLS
jgi:hypothetical protein